MLQHRQTEHFMDSSRWRRPMRPWQLTHCSSAMTLQAPGCSHHAAGMCGWWTAWRAQAPLGYSLVFTCLREQLSQLTGIAAILRFPVPELSDQENDSSSERRWMIATNNWDNLFSLLHCYIFSASCEKKAAKMALWFLRVFMYLVTLGDLVGKTCFQTEQ